MSEFRKGKTSRGANGNQRRRPDYLDECMLLSHRRRPSRHHQSISKIPTYPLTHLEPQNTPSPSYYRWVHHAESRVNTKTRQPTTATDPCLSTISSPCDPPLLSLVKQESRREEGGILQRKGQRHQSSREVDDRLEPQHRTRLTIDFSQLSRDTNMNTNATINRPQRLNKLSAADIIFRASQTHRQIVSPANRAAVMASESSAGNNRNYHRVRVEPRSTSTSEEERRFRSLTAHRTTSYNRTNLRSRLLSLASNSRSVHRSRRRPSVLESDLEGMAAEANFVQMPYVARVTVTDSEDDNRFEDDARGPMIATPVGESNDNITSMLITSHPVRRPDDPILYNANKNPGQRKLSLQSWTERNSEEPLIRLLAIRPTMLEGSNPRLGHFHRRTHSQAIPRRVPVPTTTTTTALHSSRPPHPVLIQLGEDEALGARTTFLGRRLPQAMARDPIISIIGSTPLSGRLPQELGRSKPSRRHIPLNSYYDSYHQDNSGLRHDHHHHHHRRRSKDRSRRALRSVSWQGSSKHRRPSSVAIAPPIDAYSWRPSARAGRSPEDRGLERKQYIM